MLTSRDPTFTRSDTATRILPLRYAPIASGERKTEREILTPVVQQRGRILGGLLRTAGYLQDLFPELPAASRGHRLAEFEEFGGLVYSVYGWEGWTGLMERLAAAQKNFVL